MAQCSLGFLREHLDLGHSPLRRWLPQHRQPVKNCIIQTFSTMVTQYAQNEHNFNSVERVLVYTELSPDGKVTTPNDPPPSWPETGAGTFRLKINLP
ncbi:hypothetical protein FIBSPDRAFT_943119 [Athelia psychrophila]|uniref:Uncharacterized protein n=1 Tax=Athelia psychrophila TaxID=1759441 RepID=A0A166WS17_9AGAM|nr:hypothetical protein FIBSPDRAFT_943119 [Fibularhizoctonia sp. CBS 109695]